MGYFKELDALMRENGLVYAEPDPPTNPVVDKLKRLHKPRRVRGAAHPKNRAVEKAVVAEILRQVKEEK